MQAVHKQFSGFMEDLSQIRKYVDVPQGLKEAIQYTEKETGGKVRVVSVGPDRDQTIIKG